MEQFANNCQTFVATGGYTAASGVLNVVSTAAPFPQVGDFRVSIFDAATKLLKVILKVTAVNSGTQFAVTAEGTDGNCNAGDLVQGTMITAGVMKNIGKVLLEEHTASNSATLDFTASLTSLYDEYEIELIGILPATDGAEGQLLVSVDGGSNWDTGSNYAWAAHYMLFANGATGVNYSGSDTKIEIGTGQVSNATANGGINASFKLYDPLSATKYKIISGIAAVRDNRDSDGSVRRFGAEYKSTTAINALRFKFSSGNITSGTIRIYGVAK